MLQQSKHKGIDHMPFDLIHTSNANAAAIDLQTIIDNCPAVLTGSKSPDVSNRYGLVSSLGAINVLADYGYRPVKAIQRPSRKEGQQHYAAHMLSFAHDRDLESDSETRPEVIIYNSHDGKSALKIFAGAYRFICSNGIIAGDGFQASMRHSNKTAQGFESLLADQAKALPEMMHKINTMKQTKIDNEQAVDFAYNAATLRWEYEDQSKRTGRGSFAYNATVSDMLRPERYEDKGQDIWTMFNIAQEKLIRGGARILSHTETTTRRGYPTIRKARAIQSLPETVRINRKLWDLAELVAA